jgi:endonuclease-3 related protein|uniref:Endonuclease III domain-containing protein n=1 Tax=candidate division WOR-3 bacterium TaxID=2052148 RepID=A0A7V3V013_UNCW3
MPAEQPTAAASELGNIYQRLYQTFGPQHWWPARTRLEVIIGAVLTQNTAWQNVEKAIANLKKSGLLNLNRLCSLPPHQLAALIRPAGYYNLKSRRLLALLHWLKKNGGISKISTLPTAQLRENLLNCYGIGPETADSILLYALDRPVFVVDAYTRRILSRYGLITGDESYEQLRLLIENSLAPFLSDKQEPAVRVYNEFHALLVKLAKTHCRSKPSCSGCPLDSR